MNTERPDPNLATQLYQGASGREYHQVKRGLDPLALEWIMKLRAEKFQPFVRDTDVVCELGVGAGWNLGRLRCARKVGCDVTEELAPQVTALGIEFVRDPVSLPDGFADVAICHHTLEHLPEPVVALRQLSRVLKPSGRLVLHVPWELERRYRRYHPGEPNHHLYTWNAQNLGNLLTVLGWSIETINIRRYGYDRFAANLAVQLRCGEIGFHFVRKMMIAACPLREVEVVARPPRNQ